MWRRQYCAVTTFDCCSRTVVRAICILRKHAQLCACFRAQDTTQWEAEVWWSQEHVQWGPMG